MKDKYTLSIWEQIWKDDQSIEPDHGYFDQRRIANIGSDDSDFIFRAYDPQLKEDIKGNKTLTFTMRMIDDIAESTYDDFLKLVDSNFDELLTKALEQLVVNSVNGSRRNLFLPYLVPGRIIKLFWNNEWYDFIISQTTEDSSSSTIKVVCEDLFMNELSKNGYNIVLDTQLENNMGTITELAARVIDKTDWHIIDANGNIGVVKTVDVASGVKTVCFPPFYTWVKSINTNTNTTTFSIACDENHIFTETQYSEACFRWDSISFNEQIELEEQIKKYNANFEYDLNYSTSFLGLEGDTNGDGKIDAQDVIRLKNYKDGISNTLGPFNAASSGNLVKRTNSIIHSLENIFLVDVPFIRSTAWSYIADPSITATTPSNYLIGLFGDANGDGFIDSGDVIRISTVYQGQTSSSFICAGADVDRNGNIYWKNDMIRLKDTLATAINYTSTFLSKNFSSVIYTLAGADYSSDFIITSYLTGGWIYTDTDTNPSKQYIVFQKQMNIQKKSDDTYYGVLGVASPNQGTEITLNCSYLGTSTTEPSGLVINSLGDYVSRTNHTYGLYLVTIPSGYEDGTLICRLTQAATNVTEYGAYLAELGWVSYQEWSPNFNKPYVSNKYIQLLPKYYSQGIHETEFRGFTEMAYERMEYGPYKRLIESSSSGPSLIFTYPNADEFTIIEDSNGEKKFCVLASIDDNTQIYICMPSNYIEDPSVEDLFSYHNGFEYYDTKDTNALLSYNTPSFISPSEEWGDLSDIKSDIIYNYINTPAILFTASANFVVTDFLNYHKGEGFSIEEGELFFIFYDDLIEKWSDIINNGAIFSKLQFGFNEDYEKNLNNGTIEDTQLYEVTSVKIEKDGDELKFFIKGDNGNQLEENNVVWLESGSATLPLSTNIFTIAKLGLTQEATVDPITGEYMYKWVDSFGEKFQNHVIYGNALPYITTASMVYNFITNSSNFSDTKGWSLYGSNTFTTATTDQVGTMNAWKKDTTVTDVSIFYIINPANNFYYTMNNTTSTGLETDLQLFYYNDGSLQLLTYVGATTNTDYGTFLNSQITTEDTSYGLYSGNDKYVLIIHIPGWTIDSFSSNFIYCSVDGNSNNLLPLWTSISPEPTSLWNIPIEGYLKFDIPKKNDLNPIYQLIYSDLKSLVHDYKVFSSGQELCLDISLSGVETGEFNLYLDLYYKNGSMSYLQQAISFTKEENSELYTCKIPDSIKFSQDDLVNYDPAVVITFTAGNSEKSLALKSISLYTKVEVNGEIMTPNSVIAPLEPQKFYKYYDHTKTQKEQLSANQIEWLHAATTQYDLITNKVLVPKVNDTYEKVTSISIKESNRFNILQKLCEIFNCYMTFTIKHENDGRIALTDTNHLPKKFITFHNKIGINQNLGFDYGIDLKSIKRNLNAKTLATQMYVKPNMNDLANESICGIAQSVINPSRQSYILNFDFLINNGIIPSEIAEQLLKDIYNDQGLYPVLHDLNIQYDDINRKARLYQRQLGDLQSQLKFAQDSISTTQKNKVDVTDTIFSYTRTSSWQEVIDEYQDNPKNTYLQSKFLEYQTLLQIEKDANIKVDQLNKEIDKVNTLLQSALVKSKSLFSQVQDKEQKFQSRYKNYIFEGVWNDPSYIDPDLYYAAAVIAAKNASQPQLQYDINIMRLTGIETLEAAYITNSLENTELVWRTITPFKGKTLNIGDTCYIRDPDFFINKDTKIEVTITERTLHLDEPMKDSIKVQNYRTQFEDLFQRVASTIAQVQLAKSDKK